MLQLVGKGAKQQLLKSCEKIELGRLRVVTPEGERYDFGNSGIEAELIIRDWAVAPAIAARGDIGLGEAYMSGLWETPSVEDVSIIALKNLHKFGRAAKPSWIESVKLRIIDQILRANSRRGAARNIRAHYDVGNEFYQLWLDETMTYSSAIFTPNDTDLRRGQLRKYDRILDRITDAENILEIGCGWGGFAERAVSRGQHVTGVTISPSQKGYADARLDGQADIRLEDYRDINGQYDAIVSIEMIEAVGQRYWPAYFKTIRDRLRPGGQAMIQAITVPDENFDEYAKSSDFIRHYTFPGGMLLSDAQMRKQAANAGLKVNDSFSFGQSYAQTCRLWSQKMETVASRLLMMGYDTAFNRSWKYYLGICAAAFAIERTNVVQYELSRAN